MIVGERRLPGDRLDDGDAMPLGERAHRVGRVGVVNATARDQHRPLGAGDDARGPFHVAGVGTGPSDVVDAWLEEPRWEVVGLGLDVLREREERWPTRRRIEHRGQCLGEGPHDLRRLGDAIPVAGHRLEGVGHGDGRVAEVFDLLEDGVDDAVLERVAGQQQDRQPVGVGDGRRRHHVGRAWPDRGRGDHDPLATHRLGVGHGRERHRLLVLPAPCRQLVLDGLERLGQGRHVAVPEDAEHAGEDGDVVPVDHRPLSQQPAHDRLCGGQSDRLHRVLSLARLEGGPSCPRAGMARATW